VANRKATGIKPTATIVLASGAMVIFNHQFWKPFLALAN